MREGSAIAKGDAFFSAPVRTDASGHVHLSVPLGDIETTWGLGIVALPDGAPAATTTLEIPALLPISASVFVGASWTEGDHGEARVTIRNHTKSDAVVEVRAEASGSAQLVEARPRSVKLPAGGTTVLSLLVKAGSPGEAAISVTASAPGIPPDVSRLTWDVLPAGEEETRVEARWVNGEATIEVPPDPAHRFWGRPRLVLERGAVASLSAALDGSDPDRMSSPDALARSLETASRIKAWALANANADLEARADRNVRIALGRLEVMRGRNDTFLPAALRRMQMYAIEDPAKKKTKPPENACPPTGESDTMEWVEAEPAPSGQAALPCWETFVSNAIDEAIKGKSPAMLARLILAFADRPHRAALFATLTERLRKDAGLDEWGRIEISSSARTDRVLIYAALLRGARVAPTLPIDRLVGWLVVDRDASGSFGSPEATLAAVQALLASGLDAKGETSVTIEGMAPIVVGANARAVVPLPPNQTAVTVRTKGPWIVARLERPRLRLFSHPDFEETSLRLDVTWPANIRRGVATIHAVASSPRPVQARIDIPLPPGVSLAEPMHGVRQMRGHLVILRSIDSGPTPIDVPLRFALAGSFTAREARIVSPSVAVRGVASARAIVVR